MARSKGMGQIKKRGKYYYLITKVNGVETAKSLRETSRKAAENKAKEFIGETLKITDKSDVIYQTAKNKNLLKHNKFTINQIWDYFNENLLTRKNILTSTKNRYKYRLNLFLKWNKNNDDIRKPYEITPAYVSGFINHLYTLELSQKTLNDVVKNLKRIFDVIKEEAGIVNNPFAGITINAKAETVQKKIITDDQLKDLFEYIDTIDLNNKGQYRLLFMLAAYTGARLKDCCLIAKENINLKECIISYTPSKTKKTSGKTAIVPILEDLRPFLMEAYNKADNQYLIPEVAELYNKNRKYVITVTNKIFKGAGIKDIEAEENCKTGKRKPCLYGFHSIRYYFITYCCKKNIPLKMIMDAVGHSRELMNLYYQQFNNADRLAAFGVDNSIKNRIIKMLDNADNNTLNKIFDLLNNKISS